MNRKHLDRVIGAVCIVALLAIGFAIANSLAGGEPEFFRLLPGKP